MITSKQAKNIATTINDYQTIEAELLDKLNYKIIWAIVNKKDSLLLFWDYDRDLIKYISANRKNVENAGYIVDVSSTKGSARLIW